MSDITKRLLEACTGHPAAEIPWPHRLLHEAVDVIQQQESQLAELEAKIKRLTSRGIEQLRFDNEQLQQQRSTLESIVQYHPGGGRMSYMELAEEYVKVVEQLSELREAAQVVYENSWMHKRDKPEAHEAMMVMGALLKQGGEG